MNPVRQSTETKTPLGIVFVRLYEWPGNIFQVMAFADFGFETKDVRSNNADQSRADYDAIIKELTK